MSKDQTKKAKLYRLDCNYETNERSFEAGEVTDALTAADLKALKHFAIPVDGKKVALINPDKGGKGDGGDGGGETKPDPTPVEIEEVVAAIATLAETKDAEPDNWTQAGLPQVNAIEALLDGRQISADDRTAAFEIYQQQTTTPAE